MLNHGSFGACPKPILARQQALRAEMEAEPVQFLWRHYEERLDPARRAVAGFAGANPRDLVFVTKAPTSAEAVNTVFREESATGRYEGILGVAEDPIVSSDVIDSTLSLLFDACGTMRAGKNFLKTLSWYESRGHAARLLDVARLYGDLDSSREAA